ncbi:MAG: hypothetical protein P8L42_01660, partial [Flavicella sp.]|nr:hypothetical protein [Flavicella sp.]
MLLLLVLSVLLAQPSVQTKVGSKVTEFLYTTYDADISVEKIKISVLGKVELKGVLIKDHHKDTLIAVEKISSELLKINSLLKNKLILGESELF